MNTWRKTGLFQTSLSSSRSFSCTLNLDQQFRKFLFAFGLVLAGFGFGHLRDVHGAEFWAAHGAELRFFVKVVGQIFVVHGARGVRIERQLKLFVPVEQEARVAERVVAIAR